MTIETYKVEAVTSTGSMRGDTILGYSISFNLRAENISVDASAYVEGNADKSFNQWNDYLHVILGIKKD